MSTSVLQSLLSRSSLIASLCVCIPHLHANAANSCMLWVSFMWVQGLRAIPVRVGSRVYQRQQFKAKRGVSSAGRLGTPTKTSGLNQTLTKSMGGYGTSPLRKLTSHSRHASRCVWLHGTHTSCSLQDTCIRCQGTDTQAMPLMIHEFKHICLCVCVCTCLPFPGTAVC